MQQHAVAHITSATTTTLISAPGAGLRVTILNFHLSAGAAGAITAGFSSGDQRVYDAAANQSFDDSERWEGDANAAFSVTTPGTGPTDIEVDYLIEQSPS
jgi:hypothetical protein